MRLRPQGYAWEITTKEGGWGLDDVLKSRQHVLNGIANGIDTAEWDPANDKFLPASYSASDLSGQPYPLYWHASLAKDTHLHMSSAKETFHSLQCGPT